MSLPAATEVLTLEETRTQVGLWGVGVTIAKIPPHHVLSVDCLKGPNDEDYNPRVEEGDLVYGVNNIMVEQASLESVESIVFGDLGTMCKIDLISQKNGQHYSVEVKRHVPIRLWEQIMRRYNVRREYEGQDFLAENAIVDTLEGIRTFVNDGSGNALDLLKDERHVRSTLGIRMLPHGSPHRRANINPREVHGVTPGGPAALSRKIKIGDEVVAVDGVELDPGRAIEQVRGNDTIGARVILTLKRGPQVFDVELVRASATAARNAEQLHHCVEDLERSIKQSTNDPNVFTALNAVIRQTMRMEQDRHDHEATLCDKLNQLQDKIFKGISTAESMLHPLPENQYGVVEKRSVTKVRAPPPPEQAMRAAPPPPQAPDNSAELKALQDEIQRLKDELERSLADNKALQTENKALRTGAGDTESLLRDNAALSAENERLKDELRKLRDALAEANAAASKAISDASAANLEADRAREEKDRALAELERLRARLEKLEKNRSESDSDRGRELEEERAESERLRQQCKQLRDQLKLLKDELETLQIRISTEMVPRSDWLQAVQQAKDAQNTAADLQTEVQRYKSVEETLRRELESTKARYQSVFDELQRLRMLVQQAGFSEDRDLEKFAQAMAGPPQVYNSEIIQLLELLQGPPRRTLAEVRRIIEIMNEPQPWTAEDLARVRAIMRGPPALSPQDLQQLIAEHRSAPPLEEVGRLQQDYQMLLQERNQLKGLEQENLALQDELTSLRERLAKLTEMMGGGERELSQLREEKEGLNQQCLSMQKVIEKLRARVAELEAELAALKDRMARERAHLLVPIHHPPGIQFSESLQVILCCGIKDSTVYYTTDDSTPSPSNNAGSGPAPLKITLKESSVVKAMCVAPDGQSGTFSAEQYPMREREVRKAAPPAPAPVQRAAPAPPPPVQRAAPIPVVAAAAPTVQAQIRPPQAPLLAGVGMLLERFDGDDRVFVKRVVPGTPADFCGQIQIGDILVAVENKNVETYELDEIFRLVLGKADTKVSFSFAREVRQVVPEGMYASVDRAPSVKYFNLSLVRQHIMTHDELENSMSSHPHNQISAHGGPGPRWGDSNGSSLNTSYSSYGRLPGTSSYPAPARSPMYAPEDTQDSWLLGLNNGMRNLSP